MSMNGFFLVVPTDKREEFLNHDGYNDELGYVTDLSVEQAWHMIAILTELPCYYVAGVADNSSIDGMLSAVDFECYFEVIEDLTHADIIAAMQNLDSDELEEIYRGKSMQNNPDFVLENFDRLKNGLELFSKTGEKYDLYFCVN